MLQASTGSTDQQEILKYLNGCAAQMRLWISVERSPRELLRKMRREARESLKGKNLATVARLTIFFMQGIAAAAESWLLAM